MGNAPAATESTRKSLKYISDTTQYYPHQIEGVRWLAKRSSFLLADDMGLGKSLQALTVAAVDFEKGWAERVLIVCPATLKGNWENEAAKHTSFKAMVLDGPPKKRERQFEEFVEEGYHLLIVNYEQVPGHLRDLNALKFDVIIYDEAHYIKNPKSKRTRASQALKAKRHFLLTGSPMLNHVNDLWSLLHRIAPDEFPNYWRFVNRYCNTPDAPVWMADGTFRPLGKVQVGDEVMGWERVNGRRSRRVATVEAIESRIAPEVIQVTLESGNVIKCTPDHAWLSTSHGGYSAGTLRVDEDIYVPIAYQGMGQPSYSDNDVQLQIKALSKVVDVPPDLTPEQQRMGDWLAGIYDGEGSGYFIAQSIKHNPEIYNKIIQTLVALDIPFSSRADGISLKGGIHTYVKFLHWFPQLVKRDYFLKRLLKGNRREVAVEAQMNRVSDRIVKVESLGPGEVVSMQTSTGNYVVWGYASKNCVFGGFKDKQIVGVKNNQELRDRLNDYMLRRRKKDVLDLPDKQYIPVYVDLHPEQRKLYREVNDEMQLTLPDDPDPMEIENALVKFTRLKEICGTTAAIEGYDDHSYKLDRAVEMVQEITEEAEENVVVFTQFRAVLKAMDERLADVGVPTYSLHGDVKRDLRTQIVEEWNNASKPSALVSMLQVGGVGLNFTSAQRCIFLDKLFSPKMNEQAEDRLHRIGSSTTQPVQIYEIVARNTIEQRIKQILERKSHVFGEIVETSELKKKLVQSLKEDGEA